MKNPVLDLSLKDVMRQEIALTLQHVMQVYTVGNFLAAWRNPKQQRSIEQIFDSPQQARHAAAVCATWLGVSVPAAKEAQGSWWAVDDAQPLDA